MVKDLRIVCLAASEWDFAWQPSQEVMLRLARTGNRVLYVEPTGTRNIRLGDWKRVQGRFKTKIAGPRQAAPLPETLCIYAPLIVPYPHSRLARHVNRWILLRAIRNWLGDDPRTDFVLWVCFPSRLNIDLVEKAGANVNVYQIMSTAEATRAHAEIGEASEALLKRCDLIFANARRLCDQAHTLNTRAYLFRAGVNLEVFEATGGEEITKPADLEGIPGPVIGYAGAIHQWVDVELLASAAASMPDCQFVLMGPIVRDVSALRRLPNVHFLGQKPHGEVPRYVRHFDVCIIPYVRNAYTETSFPGKLNEYLALGKPVVATPIPEVEDFNREYDGVLHLAGDRTSFVAAVRSALAGTTPALRERYRQVARANSWAVLVEGMSRVIEETLRTRSTDSP
jgi:glycosyltransferase involved in cell wall biosynthesis